MLEGRNDRQQLTASGTIIWLGGVYQSREKCNRSLNPIDLLAEDGPYGHI